MALSYEASVVHKNGIDYWRTWFVEECEKFQLFGVNKKYIDLIKLSGGNCSSYCEGTKIFLEDAPYFHKFKEYHLVRGPYVVFETNPLPDGATIIHKDYKDKTILYLEKHPEKGPWLDLNSISRVVDNTLIKYKKIASQFDFYPYRFSIKKAPDFRVEKVKHESIDCWLCKTRRLKR